jgi:choline monooxygenase
MRPLPIVDPDIRKARTLPGWFYGHLSWHERVLRRVFSGSWQLVPPHVVTAEQPVVPFEAGGVPLVRTAAGVFSNVCTHRGAILTEQPCATLRCPYHGRRFGLDGRMQGAPGFDDIRDADHLPALPVRRVGPLEFVGLGGDFPGDTLELPEGPWKAGPSAHYDIPCSWALYVENYLEGLHIPFVHPGLNAALDWRDYENRVDALSTLQLGLSEGAVVARYWWLWPNTMVNLYDWGLSLNVVEPTAADRCRVHYHALIRDPQAQGDGAGGDLDTVESEDQRVVTSVQQGVRSPLYDRGRFSPTHEQGVHRFQCLLSQALRD